MGKAKDLSGMTFGRLTVIKEVSCQRKDRKTVWLCSCLCGAETSVVAGQLLQGRTRSCGCLQRDSARDFSTLGPNECVVIGDIAFMTIISKGLSYVVLFDARDKPMLDGYRWCLKRCQGRMYVRDSMNDGSFHRILMADQISQNKGLEIDHANGNTLDNRRCNLRLATPSQNSANRHVTLARSGFRGVTFDKELGMWRASIRHNRKQIYLGSYLTAQEAALAYDREARRIFGKFAFQNGTHRKTIILARVPTILSNHPMVGKLLFGGFLTR